MMYLILKERHYSDIDTINDKLKGYQLINDNKNISFSIVRYESPLLLTEEVA